MAIIAWGAILDTGRAGVAIHDELNRLKLSSHNNGITVIYAYDAFGNRLSRTITVSMPAEIKVENPSTTPPTDLANGSASLAFPSTAVGQSASSRLTIRNTGQTPLTSLSAILDGAHSADFSISGLPTSLSGGASTTITLTFSPTALGSRATTLHIASNDADENPFDVSLAGMGTTGGSSFDESLSFDNNQVPADWTLGFPVGGSGRNASIANGRFEVREVDTYAGLDRAKEVPVWADLVVVSYTGNVTANYWGQGTQVRFLTSDGEFFASFGKSGYGEPTMKATVGKEPIQPWPFQEAFALETGTYRMSAVFEDNRVTYTIRREGSMIDLVNVVVQLPELKIHQLQTLRLLTLTTSGEPSWIDDVSIRAFSRAAHVEIAVEDPNTTPPSNLVDGSTSLTFPSIAVSQSANRTLTIRNTGQAPLTSISAIIDGANSADFSTTPLPHSLPAGASATLTLTYSPTAPGIHAATLHIASNDPDESPFDIALSGMTTSPEVQVAFNAATDVPVTANGYDATGKSLSFSLGFLPARGTALMAVNNTGLLPVTGRFNGLIQGTAVSATFGGIAYPFVINYFGGDGNDVVLEWKHNSLVGWGWNTYGQLADGSTTDRFAPVIVASGAAPPDVTWIATAVGQGHSLALTADGRVFAWGLNDFGQIGDGTTSDRGLPVQVSATGALAGKKVVAIAAGKKHSLAVAEDGTVYAWGWNQNGQLGDGSTAARSTPVAVSTAGALAGKTAIAVSAGSIHSLALTSDGHVVGWGANGTGRLGNGGTTDSLVPTDAGVGGALAGKAVAAISAGGEHSLALTTNGDAVAWGRNQNGQLGDGTTSTRLSPVGVSGLSSGVRAISAGGGHSLALDSNGNAHAWGLNRNGQLGNGTVDNKTTPTGVHLNLAQFLQGIVAGSEHSYVLCYDGSAQLSGRVWSWGLNDVGELGISASGFANSPVKSDVSGILAERPIVALARGPSCSHNIAIAAKPLPGPEIAVLGSDYEGQPMTVRSGVYQLSLGTLSPGSTATGSVTIRNIGDQPLVGLGVIFSGSGAGDYQVTQQPPNSLAPGVSATVSLRLTASTLGARSASVLIASNDADENPFEVRLYGYVRGSEIEISEPGTAPLRMLADGTDTLDFGRVLPGQSASRTLQIQNIGNAALASLAVTIDGANATAWSAAALPQTSLSPNGATTFALQFSPDTDGVGLANLHIASNDPDENPFDISLTGSRVSGSYWAWAGVENILQHSRAAPGADVNGNTLSNFTEYAFGISPSSGLLPFARETGGTVASPGLPSHSLVDASGKRLRLVFARRSDHAARGLLYRPEFSSDLINWLPATNPLSLLASNSSFDIVSVDDQLTLDQAARRFGRVTVEEQVVVLSRQPGPSDGKDFFITNWYGYSTGATGQGGAHDDHRLRVGGYADYYHSLLEFDLTGMPQTASRAIIRLYAMNDGTPTPIHVDRVAAAWGWNPTFVWAQRPVVEEGPALVEPAVNSWYEIDVTEWYNGWKAGTYPNHGIQMRPVYNNNHWSTFYSSNYTGDPSLRPTLIVTP